MSGHDEHAKHAEPAVDDLTAHDLTPEQIGVLAEFADSAIAARKLAKFMAWIVGSLGMGAAAAYYAMSAWNSIHALTRASGGSQQ
jgi:hypothetical protein